MGCVNPSSFSALPNGEAMRIQDISLAKKLAAAYAILGFPIILLSYFLVIEKNDLISFTQQEIAGVHYLSALQQGFSVALSSDASSASIGDVASAIRKAEEEDKGGLALTQKSKDIVAGLNSGTVAEVAPKIAEAISAASDNSNITLDPDADAYFVGDLLVNQSEGILQRTSDLVSAAQNLKK